MQAADIVVRAEMVLQDLDGVRWTQPELLMWIADGEGVIVLVRPDACSANVEIDLVGGTKQTIPTTGLRLLDVVRNVGGRAVRLVDREILDTTDPNWHMAKGSSVIRNYVFDNRDPHHFYVSPPAMTPDPKLKPANASLEIIMSRAPDPVTDISDTLTLSDIYMDPLVNYVLFRCYIKDAQFAQNAQLASGYLQTFMNMLGVKTKKDVAFSPEMNSKGGEPNMKAISMEGV